MLPVLNIGPLAIPTPAFILLIGFWLGLELAEKQAELFGASPKHIYNLTLVAVIAGLVGARVTFLVQVPQVLLDSPLSLLSPRPEMLDAAGGVVIAILAAGVYLWRQRLKPWVMLDALTGLLVVLGVTLGLSHFASGDAFGAPTTLPWAIELWGQMRHPSQVYETLAALAIGWLVWPGSRIAQSSKARPGLRWWAFLALSAAARLVLESFRGDSTLILGLFRQAQVIAWFVLAVSLWQIGRWINHAAVAKEVKPMEQA